MEKNNYKPRIVAFDTAINETAKIDTRLGAFGFYPGDELSCPSAFRTGPKCYVIGYSEGGLWVTSDNVSGKAFSFFAGSEVNYTLVKRHAQHLIDSGEMIQCVENK